MFSTRSFKTIMSSPSYPAPGNHPAESSLDDMTMIYLPLCCSNQKTHNKIKGITDPFTRPEPIRKLINKGIEEYKDELTLSLQHKTDVIKYTIEHNCNDHPVVKAMIAFTELLKSCIVALEREIKIAKEATDFDFFTTSTKRVDVIYKICRKESLKTNKVVGEYFPSMIRDTIIPTPVKIEKQPLVRSVKAAHVKIEMSQPVVNMDMVRPVVSITPAKCSSTKEPETKEEEQKNKELKELEKISKAREKQERAQLKQKQFLFAQQKAEREQNAKREKEAELKARKEQEKKERKLKKKELHTERVNKDWENRLEARSKQKEEEHRLKTAWINTHPHYTSDDLRRLENLSVDEREKVYQSIRDDELVFKD